MSLLTVTLSAIGGRTAVSLVAGGVVGAACDRLLSQYQHHRLGVIKSARFGRSSTPPSATRSFRNGPSEVGRLRARLAAGRLSLPQRTADIIAQEGAVLDAVNHFVNDLAELPTDEWLEIGRVVTADSNFKSARATASAYTEALLADRGLLVTAWYARDGVETAFCLATDRSSRVKAADRRLLAAAHGAAEQAALALLCRGWLDKKDFDVLYQPFAVRISVSN